MDGKFRRFHYEKVDAGVVAREVNVAVRVGRETTGQRREVRERSGKRLFEENDEVIEGKGRRRQQNSFLNVLTGEHRDV